MLHRYRLSLAGLKGDLKRSDISSFATLQSQGQNGDYARVKKGVYREVLGRGDWRSFEPYPQLIALILAVFEGAALPFVATAERLVRLCA